MVRGFGQGVCTEQNREVTVHARGVEADRTRNADVAIQFLKMANRGSGTDSLVARI